MPIYPVHQKYTFVLYYNDVRVEYDSSHGSGSAAPLLLYSLLDSLAEPCYEPLREVIVKMLAFSVWQEHPDVKKIRAIFGSVNMPGISDFEHGKKESFQPMFSFDFSLRNEENQSTTR